MRKIKGLRWYVIVLVAPGIMLGYLTRNTVVAAAPTLMEELNISAQQYLYIVAVYSAAYIVMQPIAGYVLDALGTKIGCAMSAVLWAVFYGATASAGSWSGLAIARGAVGTAEATIIPAGLKASSEWFPAKERSITVGHFNVGSSIGAMIAPPLVVWAIVVHNWQAAFIISGASSFIWVMAWLTFYKHLYDQKYLTDGERGHVINGQEAQYRVSTAKKMSVGQVLRSHQFWDTTLPRFLAEPIWGTFNAWIPLSMFKVYGFSLKEIAMFTWVPMLFADLGYIPGGYLPSLSQRWLGVDLAISRRMIITLGVVLMIGPGIVSLFINLYVAAMLLCTGGFTRQTPSGALIALSFDASGRSEMAVANGLTGMFVQLANTLFALIVGILADTIDFNPPFAVLVVFDLLGVLVIQTVLQNKLAAEVAQEICNDPALQH